MNLNIPYYLENYIGGNLIGPLSGKFIDNVNPSTGEVFTQVPDSKEKDIDIEPTLQTYLEFVEVVTNEVDRRLETS